VENHEKPNTLARAGWIDFASMTIDSAPVKAFVNLGEANKEIKLKVIVKNKMQGCQS
jgi:hypothetical protein